MLASPGVDLRRDDISSVTHVSSLGFFNADGVPFQTYFVAPTTNTTTTKYIQQAVLGAEKLR